MKSISVKELMVPLSEYAVVSEDDTLHEAVMALERAQEQFEKNRYIHRAILVKGKRGNIVGKVSQRDIIIGLEPNYKKIGEVDSIVNIGFSKTFLMNLIDQYHLWDAPLEDICRKASKTKVKKIMTTPTKGEYIDAEATLDQAAHQLVMGIHQSLLVLENKTIIGILRLVDVFKEISVQIKACKI